MVPWPIALLSLFYGVIAAVSAAIVWKILAGVHHPGPVGAGQSIMWALCWLVLAIGVTCGLPLLKAWARGWAVFGSVVMMITTLAVAGLLAASGHPLGALIATVSAATHVVIIRYLQRPAVKAYFLGDVSHRSPDTGHQ